MEFIDFSDDYVELNPELMEAKSSSLPPKTLGRFRGTFFIPGGVSRNNRYYPESLWRKVLESDEVKASLKNGMIGTLLHPKEEKYAHPIYSSHVVKRLWIDEKKKTGMGEAYLLDTPVGRVCETFAKSGLVKLYVSSRAWGRYDGEMNGIPVVDEDNFLFKTFDLVLDPGFLEASPQFSEQLEMLSECFLENINEWRLSRVERESKAVKLIRDVDIILKNL